MPIINITPPNYKINDNIQEQVNKHNIDKNAHEGLSLPANGGNADTVDGKHAADLQNYNNLTNKPISMKNPYSLTVQFNGSTQKMYDGSSSQTLNITPSGIGAAAGSHTHSYSSLTNIPTSFPANGGNADTIDGKHASNFVTDSQTEANKYTTVLSWAVAQNQSAIAYSSADSSLSNAEDKPSNGQYGQFHYLLLKGENTRKTVLAFEYGLTGQSIYRRCIFNSSWIDSWIKISDNGNADTVDNYHAYQLQNYGSSGTPEGTYLKSQYDSSKGKFYIKAYDKGSGNYLTGAYVDSAGNADTVEGKHASDFAPSGYGLGTAAKEITNANEAVNNGYYSIVPGTGINIPNTPDGIEWIARWGIVTVAPVWNWIIQYAVPGAVSQTTVRDCPVFVRRYNNDSWTAWEALSPIIYKASLPSKTVEHVIYVVKNSGIYTKINGANTKIY